MREKDLTCSGCGLPRDETMRTEAQFLYSSEPIRCHACAARDRAAHDFTRGEHDDAGILFTIEEKDG